LRAGATRQRRFAVPRRLTCASARGQVGQVGLIGQVGERDLPAPPDLA
jgi:hypothetical protein